MLVNLNLAGDQGRVWPIQVGGQQIGYIVLTLGHFLDFAGHADSDSHNERLPASTVLEPHRRPALLHAQAAELVEQLTAREREVLCLIAGGLSNQAIADKLFLSIGTVKAYTSQIYGKLGVRSRTQAVARAHDLKLLAPLPSTQPPV